MLLMRRTDFAQSIQMLGTAEQLDIEDLADAFSDTWKRWKPVLPATMADVAASICTAKCIHCNETTRTEIPNHAGKTHSVTKTLKGSASPKLSSLHLIAGWRLCSMRTYALASTSSCRQEARQEAALLVHDSRRRTFTTFSSRPL
jgi:hypothetical protein